MADQSPDLPGIMRYFEQDHFAASSGVRILELGPGFARAALTVEDRHLNSVGTVQGGATFTLADLAFAMACNSGGRVAVALNTNLSFVKAVRTGVLYAEATEVARSRRISTCTVRVTDDEGHLTALFQGTAFIKDEPFPPAGDQA